MGLIDEIEAAAAVWEKDSASATEVVESPWWQRLKAALLAGEEMARVLEDDPEEHGQGSEHYAPECRACQALVEFRAATEGEK